MNYPTPATLRTMADETWNHVPAEEREGVRQFCLDAADGLEQRGFYVSESGQTFLITEAKALTVEMKGIADAAHEEMQAPGWRCFYEGKVQLNAAGTDLEPVLAVEPTQNQYASHDAAVLDHTHAYPGKPLTDDEYEKGIAQFPLKLSKAQQKQFRQTGAVTITKAQKRLLKKQRPVYILPSYIGTATDRNGNVIGEVRR